MKLDIRIVYITSIIIWILTLSITLFSNNNEYDHLLLIIAQFSCIILSLGGLSESMMNKDTEKFIDEISNLIEKEKNNINENKIEKYNFSIDYKKDKDNNSK